MSARDQVEGFVRSACHLEEMTDVGVIWAKAPTLEKLQKKLAELLDGHPAENVIGVSHTTTTVATNVSGGLWGARRQSHDVEYSAVVLVRTT